MCLRAGEAVEACALFGGLHGQCPVHLGRDPHAELTAEQPEFEVRRIDDSSHALRPE